MRALGWGMGAEAGACGAWGRAAGGAHPAKGAGAAAWTLPGAITAAAL